MAMAGETKGSIGVASIFTILFTGLLLAQKITATNYCSIMAIFALVCIGILGFSRIKELDLTSLKIVLGDIKQAKKELFAKEDDLKFITLQLAKIISLSNSAQGRIGSAEDNELRKQWYRMRTDIILDKLEVPMEERQEMEQTYDLYDQIDLSNDADEMRGFSQQLREKIELEIREMEAS